MNPDWFKTGLCLLVTAFYPWKPARIALCVFFAICFIRQKKYASLTVFLASALWIGYQTEIRTISYPDSLYGHVSSVRENYIKVSLKDQNILVYGDYGVNYDDTVEVSCALEEITGTHNRAGFSYDTYQLSENTKYSCTNAVVTKLKNGKTFRHRVYLKLRQEPKEIQTVLGKYLFGEKGEDAGDLEGILLSAGMHISFLVGLLDRILSLIWDKKKKQPVITAAVVFLTVFFRFKMAMIRILLNDLLKYTGKNTKEKWGILVIGLLVLFPLKVAQIGFLLPVLIRLERVFHNDHPHLGVLGVSFLTQLYVNGYVRIVYPVMVFLMRSFYSAAFLLSFLWIWLPVQRILFWYNGILSKLSSFADQKLFVIAGKPHPAVFLGLVVLWIEIGSYRKRKSICLFCALFLLTLFQNWWMPYARVTFIDVGQGDAALISLPFHRANFMIDTGGLYGKNVAGEIDIPVLYSYGIQSLDAVILSHEDYDHSGGYTSLTEIIPVKKTFREKTEIIQLGDVKIRDYLYDRLYEDENSNSLTQYFSLYGTYFFFSGDLTAQGEYDLRIKTGRLPTDILKLAHHGSKTGTTDEVLACLRPKIGIISSGKHNRYHHPAYSVTERLKQYRVEYENTAYTGAVTFALFPGGWIMRTESGIFKASFSFEKLREYSWGIQKENDKQDTETDKIEKERTLYELHSRRQGRVSDKRTDP
ncbi:MAG: MBL fold metallo-hydrolase [Erysipelotrichales bacterium]|nr:MBL fold metallo-hydrolase [Erysipelotrichales bacterium]